MAFGAPELEIACFMKDEVATSLNFQVRLLNDSRALSVES